MKNTKHDAANVLSMVQPRFGSAERARIWYEEELIPGFDKRTARQMIHEGRGAEVLDYLAAIDSGIYA
ncbi:hypothetical protein GCM10022281_23010 [Sphingomonas rosea]|uniref:Antitoxin Xre/MbcA/ParS-like toxin-binding domain-containing protein n=1 Tax=Sphingomonas rosea TaxID=335605 RepID=A0ABP7UEG2_9SPHN